jgi:hypothetical protein
LQYLFLLSGARDEDNADRQAKLARTRPIQPKSASTCWPGSTGIGGTQAPGGDELAGCHRLPGAA